MTVYNLNPSALADKQDTQITRETEIRDAIGVNSASPPANSLQSRVQSTSDGTWAVASRVGDSVASPAANTLMARVQTLIDNIGFGASPAANTLQSRLNLLDNDLGAPGDAAATNDSASAGIIPLLKRALGHLSNIAGNTGMANPATSSGTLTTVSVTNTAVNLLTANSSRKGFVAYNTSSTQAFLAFGATATTSAYTIPLPGGFAYVDDSFQGVISAITASGTATINITSLS